MKARKRWIVISGGPSVGKTTLIKWLRSLGHTVIDEAGTKVINRGEFNPAVDRHGFQLECLREQEDTEGQFDKGALTFLDRGKLDGPAYYLNDGLAIPELFRSVDVSHYLVVFLLEPLPTFERDGIRPDFEDLGFTIRLTPLLEQVYRDAGVEVIRVPAMPVPQRVAFVQSEVTKLWMPAA